MLFWSVMAGDSDGRQRIRSGGDDGRVQSQFIAAAITSELEVKARGVSKSGTRRVDAESGSVAARVLRQRCPVVLMTPG